MISDATTAQKVFLGLGCVGAVLTVAGIVALVVMNLKMDSAAAAMPSLGTYVGTGVCLAVVVGSVCGYQACKKHTLPPLPKSEEEQFLDNAFINGILPKANLQDQDPKTKEE